MTSISMRCWSTGLDVGWMMKTSAPRMFSSIWNDTSLSGNRRRRACPSGMPEEVGDLRRQLRVRAAGEDLQLAEPGRHQSFTAERSSHVCSFPGRKRGGPIVGRPRPSERAPRGSVLPPWRQSPTARSRDRSGRTLLRWLGRKDSNLRIRDPKSRALPLGHAPAFKRTFLPPHQQPQAPAPLS